MKEKIKIIENTIEKERETEREGRKQKYKKSERIR